MLSLQIDQYGKAPAQLSDRCISSDRQHYLRPLGRCNPENAFSNAEAVDLPALADLEFVHNGTILPMFFGGGAEILN